MFCQKHQHAYVKVCSECVTELQRASYEDSLANQLTGRLGCARGPIPYGTTKVGRTAMLVDGFGSLRTEAEIAVAKYRKAHPSVANFWQGLNLSNLEERVMASTMASGFDNHWSNKSPDEIAEMVFEGAAKLGIIPLKTCIACGRKDVARKCNCHASV